MIKWKKRLILSGIAAMLCVAMLAGCGASGSKTTSSNAKQSGSAQTASTDTGSAEQAKEKQKKLEEEQKKKEQEEANKIPKGDKYIALTFDDGPTGNEGGRTERLLDGLKERNAHATFFLCGYRVKDFNSMMKRYLAEGHEVGNHTMDHRLAHEVSDGDYEQVSSNNDLIQSYTGQKPTVFRPCGGEYNDSVQASMQKLGMPIILWDVDTLDWKYRDAASVKQHILDGAQDGAIVLEHDLYETTVEGVLAAIDELQQQGYAFVTVSELAKIKGVTLEAGKVYNGFTDEDLGLNTESETSSESADSASDSSTANTQASDSTSSN